MRADCDSSHRAQSHKDLFGCLKTHQFEKGSILVEGGVSSGKACQGQHCNRGDESSLHGCNNSLFSQVTFKLVLIWDVLSKGRQSPQFAHRVIIA